MNKLLIAALIATAAFIWSCSPTYHNVKLANDFKTEGFLDPDTFQVVVRGVPDPAGRGLVEKRASARKNAAALFNETALRKLGNYYFMRLVESKKIRSKDEIINAPEAEAELRTKLMPYIASGGIAFEYYNEDYSAVIVYRMYKKNLADTIESINIHLLRAEGEGNRPK